jgi:hypothetical protein
MTDPQPDPYSLRDILANRPLLLAFGAILLGLCLLVVFAVLLLRGNGLVQGDGEPTPFPSVDAGGESDVIISGISGSTAISLSLNAPTSLQVGTRTFSVRPEPVGQDGQWEPDIDEAQTAQWVYGSLINYIIGLPNNDENRDLLETLSSGDELQLALRDGTQHRFAVTNREYISTERTDVYNQNMPGITLILVADRGDERLVVQGDYVVDTSPSGGGGESGGSAVELGETAQLGNIRVTVSDASALFDRPEAPPGFIFYIVNFEMQNTGAEPVDLSRMRFVLSDNLGNQYAMNPQVAQAGTNPAPAGILNSGEVRQMSAGYQIPSGLTSPTLLWQVSREGGLGEVQVSLPFAESNNAAAGQATVNLQSAEVSEDGTSLLLTGQVTNNGTQPLVVSESNVRLMSNGTVHLMLSTNPAFPWSVPPGQTVPFSLSFQRPSVAQAEFVILDYPFQLSGLR